MVRDDVIFAESLQTSVRAVLPGLRSSATSTVAVKHRNARNETNLRRTGSLQSAPQSLLRGVNPTNCAVRRVLSFLDLSRLHAGPWSPLDPGANPRAPPSAMARGASARVATRPTRGICDSCPAAEAHRALADPTRATPWDAGALRGPPSADRTGATLKKRDESLPRTHTLSQFLSYRSRSALTPLVSGQKKEELCSR